jgi:hypothetical protein
MALAPSINLGNGREAHSSSTMTANAHVSNPGPKWDNKTGRFRLEFLAHVRATKSNHSRRSHRLLGVTFWLLKQAILNFVTVRFCNDGQSQ